MGEEGLEEECGLARQRRNRVQATNVLSALVSEEEGSRKGRKKEESEW